MRRTRPGRGSWEEGLHDAAAVRLPRQEQDEKPEPPVISALSRPGTSCFTPHLHQI